MNTTTRRHPRTLFEAFPRQHAGSVQGPYRRPMAERMAGVLLAIIIGIAGAALLVHQLSK